MARLSFALAVSTLLVTVSCAPKSMLVYVGTYTNEKSEGISVLEMDLETGNLLQRSLVSGVRNPAFLAIHPSGRFLYAVSEVDDAEYHGRKTGEVAAFSIDPGDGSLALLNKQTSGGPGPCHLTVDQAGGAVLVANYAGGSVASIQLADDGRLGNVATVIQHSGSSVTPRQSAPFAHSVNVDLSNRIAVVADLGIDKVMIYRFDPSDATLKPNTQASTSVEPGSGPRHFAFHPGGRFAYVINEIGNTMTAFEYDVEKGALEVVQDITTLPEGFDGSSHTSEVQIHPSGRFVYGANRGHDSIVVFAVDEESGMLTLVEHESTQGKIPRNFGIDPTGAYLLAANADSDTIVVFRIDSKTGSLEPTGHRFVSPTPVCVRFLPR